MTCAINECGKPAHSRGWCHAHYKKWHLYGDPNHGRSYSRRQGEGTITGAGYVAVQVGGKKKQQHILVAEGMHGGPLPVGAVVHHKDRNRKNNAPGNLVICASQAAHKELHLQEDAVAAGAPPNFRRCVFCRVYCDPAEMTRAGNPKSGHYHYHKPCNAKAERERKLK